MPEKPRKPAQIKPTFFATPALFRQWLTKNHVSGKEFWVGFHKKGTAKPSITWPESVDQALCFGWIDGLRKSCDSESYMIRFTPRKSTSTWSAVNTKRAQELIRLGLMQPAGRKAFEGRDQKRSELYAYEQKSATLGTACEKQFRANRDAWTFFQSQPPSYRKTATWWVVSAKQEATRQRRLAALISDSAAGNRIAQLRPEKSGGK
ncbi:MAG: YdeI/OmpD-associated family protein [Ignavibacteriales bacterium]|nr:YdeI/OmpD-associated family protein [Ignavibacteriales bacterium]